VEVRLSFGDDGRLVSRRVVLTPENKELSTERFDKVKPADAPNLKPETKDLVILPLPYRTLEWVQAHPAHDNRLLAAHFAAAAHEITPAADLHDYIEQFHPQLGSLPGLITLLRAAGDLRVFGNFNEKVNKPLSVYIRDVVQEQRPKPTVPATSGLLQNLTRMHELGHLWTQSLGTSNAPQRRDHWRDLRDFVEKHRTDGLGWLIALVVGTDHGYTQEEWRSVAELWQLVESDPEHAYLAKYERVQCLVRGGLPNTARMTFDDLYRKTLDAGAVPVIDAQIKSLPPAEDGTTWESLLVSAAGELTRQGRPANALAVANQCWILSGAPLARQAYAQIAPRFFEFPVPLRFATAVFLARVGDRAQAEELLRPLLKEKEFADDPLVWRLAADLAGQAGSVARKVACLEKALDLEFAAMPETFDVAALRQDYDALLTGYGDLVAACKMADAAIPTDLATRVIKFADRWRSLDPDPTAACQKASRVLRQLGESELAWEYLTSPLAAGTNQAEPLKKLGDELQQSGELDLAAKALGAAYAAEPTNAELLWQQVTLLMQAGKSSEAQPLLRKLADGTWQPRFATYQSQARALLSR
jgi:tetratricopeptide (TPR) repeat protein